MFNTRLEKALEMLVPLTTKSVVVRRKVPWFTHEVKDQKRKRRKVKRPGGKIDQRKLDESQTRMYEIQQHS